MKKTGSNGRAAGGAAANATATQDSTVRVGPLSAIPAVLRELGADPAAVLGAVGFDPRYFDDPDLPVSYRALGHVLAHATAASGCEHFGLLVGMRGGPGSVGVAGHLMTLAPDVGTALDELRRYFALHDRGGNVVLDIDAEPCVLGYAVIEKDVEATDQVHDLALAVACNMMRALCGRAWTPASVQLPRRQPRNTDPWRRFFGAPVAFDAPRCAMRFARRWLATPVPTADRTLHGFVQRHADAEAADSSGADPVSAVRRLVHGSIVEGGGHAAQVGRLLGVHPRTLNRRLAAAGTTFQQVREQALHDMSLQLLAATSMPVSAAAAALGYADATAFIRAFRRWTGCTPAQWRRMKGRGTAQR